MSQAFLGSSELLAGFSEFSSHVDGSGKTKEITIKSTVVNPRLKSPTIEEVIVDFQ